MPSYAYSFLDLCLLDICVGDALLNGLQSGIFTDLYHWLGSHFPPSGWSSSNLGSPFPCKVKFDFYWMINWERSTEILCDYLGSSLSPFSFSFLDLGGVPCIPVWPQTCNLLCNWEWPWTSDTPASTSQMIWLQIWSTLCSFTYCGLDPELHARQALLKNDLHLQTENLNNFLSCKGEFQSLALSRDGLYFLQNTFSLVLKK